MKVWVMRGIPGSGKSSWVERELLNFHPQGSVVVCSADATRMVDGKYVFGSKTHDQAHGECFKKFCEFVFKNNWGELTVQVNHLVVDNTNVKWTSILPYVQVCKAYGLPFEIIHIEVPWEVAARRNVHSVPESTVWKMHREMEVIPVPETLVIGC